MLFVLSACWILQAEVTDVTKDYNPDEQIPLIIKQQYRNKNREVSVEIAEDRLKLPDKCTIDIETGGGHQGYLTFTRLELNGDECRIEKVLLTTLSLYRPAQKDGSLVQRAVVKRESIAPILETVSMLPAIKIIERYTGSPPKMEISDNGDGTFTVRGGVTISSSWSSTSDFFSLVRVMDENRKILLEKEYAGYFSSSHQLEYLPILAVSTTVKNYLDKIEKWEDVPRDKQRDCHLSDAFNLDRDHLIADFHWWVLEDSLEGLARVGNKSAHDTVKYVLSKYTGRTERIVNKIQAVAENPDYWLSGDEKDLTKIEKTAPKPPENTVKEEPDSEIF